MQQILQTETDTAASPLMEITPRPPVVFVKGQGNWLYDSDGKAYLEIWCRFPGRGEFFARGLHDPVMGSSDWASYEVPFFLKPDEVPDLLKVNLAVEGSGQVWIRNIELEHTPLDW